jgi:uncharacterized protein YrrD
MLQKALQDLQGDRVVARDGAIGAVDDVYFDDERWIVRYLGVDTGPWLAGRKVLISPACVLPSHESKAELRIALTREQVERSPAVGRDAPISRSLEAAHARYFGYPYYWSGPYLWGTAGMPVATEWSEPASVRAARANDPEAAQGAAAERRAAESHVRSVRDVVGYHLHATDGDLGRVEDFIVDDETWAIADLLVDPRGWLPGKKLLVAPGAVADVDWVSREVKIRLIRDELERTPAYR